jgi:ribose transport system permease protein
VSDPLLDRYGIFSISSIVAIAIFVLLGVFLAYTKYGREIYAIGGGRDEARAAGVPRLRPLVLEFALSGACAGLAGALASLKGGSAAPQNYDDVLLAGAAAALVGGVSLYGGRGTIVHVALGVATLSAVAAGLAAAGSDQSLTQLVTGALLIVVVAIEYGAARLSQRSKLKQAAAEHRAMGQPSHA